MAIERRALLTGALAGLCATAAGIGAARACGWEAPGGCGENSSADEARWMLNRAVAALKADRAKALEAFAHGEGGFRTADLYVFDVGPDGHFAAHPNPELNGTDARALVDPTGKAFIVEMLAAAEEGEVKKIDYKFPRLGSTKPVQKTTFFTRVGEDVVAAGFYDD